MDLLDRYLQAIRWWLPAGSQLDLVTELADDLRSQVEDKELELGRKLQEGEVIAILKRCGHPMTVAGRLLPGKFWFDPALAVVYRFVLRVVLLGVLPAALLVAHLPALLTSHNRTAVLLGMFGAIVQAALFAFAILTLIFLVLDRSRDRFGARQEWDPRRLPRLRDTRRIARAGSAVEVVVGWLFLSWWSGAASGLFDSSRFGVKLPWGELWESFHSRFYWPILLLSAAGIALSVVALFRPYWTRPRLATRTAIDGTLALTLATALRPYWADFVLQLTRLTAGRQALPATGAEQIVAQLVVVGSLAITAAIVAVVTVVDLYRTLSWKSERAAGAPDPASR